jgi:N,N'-diacetyllegionaminate synthase
MTSFPLKISDITISRDSKPLVIAEAGLDHGGSYDRMVELIEAAFVSGAKIFKTQHYHADDLIGPASQDWHERMLERQLTDDQIADAKKLTERNKMIFLCTPHTERALSFLIDLKVSVLKIGSGEVGNWPFIEKAADTGIPLIVSTGMYDVAQLSHLTRILHEARSPCAILHCTTAYPVEFEDANLKVLEMLGRIWPGVYGYSDHTIGTLACSLAVAFGATIIEKHVTLFEAGPLPSQDRIGALTIPSQFGKFIDDISLAHKALGFNQKKVTYAEFRSMTWATKSITALRAIEKDEIITPQVLCVRRPGGGLSGGDEYKVLGKTALVDISEGAFVLPEMLK